MASNSDSRPSHYNPLHGSRILHGSVVSPFAKWKSAILMMSLTLLAGLAATGHHIFYLSLDSQEVSEVVILQSWVIRIGTAFAFLFKTSLVAAVGIAFCQRFWYSARRSSLQIQSLDAIFAILSNPVKFLDADFILRTKLLFFMAAIAWLLPIAAIFSPGTLTGFPWWVAVLMVVISRSSTQTNLYPVPTPALDRDIGIFQLGSAGVFFGGSVGFQRLMLSVMASSQISPWPSPCGPNCTYSVSFSAPALSCIPESDTPLIETTYDASYNASFADPGDITNVTGNGPSGLVISVVNFTSLLVFNCTLYDATYNINVNYKDNLQTVIGETVLNNIIPSSLWHAFNSHIFEINGTSDGVAVTEWWYLLNEYTIGYTFFNFLLGTLQPQPGGAWEIGSDVVYSNLVDLTTTFEVNLPTDFSGQIETLFRNVTLSMLGYTNNPIYVGVFGDESAPAARYTSVEATVTSYPPRYSYSQTLLWELYGAALAIGCCINVIGAIALSKNGVDGDTSFSQILVTTRNSDFDRLCAESSYGGSTITNDLKKTRVKLITENNLRLAKFEITN